MSRTSKAWEALQNGLRQTVETVTRNARVDIVSGGIDEIDPPEEIDEYAETAKNTAIVRANMRKFVNDVWEPGYRVEGPDETVQYFEGEREDIDAAPPSETPEGGFLSQCFVIGGERHQDFYTGGKEATWQKWVRGTTLVEYLKADKTDPESEITGFYFIRPETVYPQVQNNTNILLPPNPEDLPDDIGEDDYTETRRGEVAAYIQFDDESILGIRRNGYDGQEIPLSQNDVLKQSLEADIGGDIGTAEGVFGTSIIEPVADDISEYKQIKRDRAEAISRKAYGVWTAQFTPEVLDLGDGGIEIIEWDDDSIGNTEAELNAMGPGDVLSSDASIDLERHDGDVPELEPTLSHYIDDIQSALPVPGVLATDFDADINRDVTGDKKDDYQQTVSEERQYQEKSWTQALRTVAERLGLPTEGLELKIQPEKSDNPVKSLETEEIDRMNSYVNTLSVAAGPQAGPTALVSSEELLDVLDFPVRDADPEDVVDEMSTEETEAAWQDIMGVGDNPDTNTLDNRIDSLESKIDALFDPVKHPRDPETGKFVERPYPVPDDIGGLSTESLISELASTDPEFADKAENLAVDIGGGENGSAVPTEIQEIIDDVESGGSEDFGAFDGEEIGVNAWSASLAQTSLNRKVFDKGEEDRFGDVREKISELHAAGNWSDGSATLKLTDTEQNRAVEALREYKESVDRVIERGTSETLTLRDPELTQRRLQTAIVELS